MSRSSESIQLGSTVNDGPQMSITWKEAKREQMLEEGFG
jgi:hypothetical protein